jgi:hypothetical protein
LEEIKNPPCDPDLLKVDKEFILKKLGLAESEFELLMKEPIRNHREFDTEGSFFHYYPALKPFRPLWNAFKSVTGKNVAKHTN